MATSTRRWHRRNLRFASSSGINDGDLDNGPSQYASNATSNPYSYPHMHNTHHSTTVLSALSDPDSELARFLFVTDDQNVQHDQHGQNETQQSDINMKSMQTRKSPWYALSLAPFEIRNERIIMLAEAYAIFGALFLSGAWILYEWGSAKGYGGANDNVILSRTFEVIMAMLFTSNLLLALFASIYWISSINSNWSEEDWVYQSRRLMTFFEFLLSLSLTLVGIALIMGMISNSNGPETIISILFCIVTFSAGTYYILEFQVSMLPLEIYHLPFWARPFFGKTKAGKKILRNRAMARAEKLKAKSYHDRFTLDPHVQGNKSKINSSSIGVILQNAATKIGRSDHDVSVYESCLEDDWFNDVDQLKNLSVEFLSRYMPWRLAQQVHDDLKTLSLQNR